MSRYAKYGKLDTPHLPEGDEAFTELNMKLRRDLLPPTVLAVSENKRLEDGAASTRAGTATPAAFNSDNFLLFQGSGVYSNPSAREVMLVGEIGEDYVNQLESGQPITQIPIAGGQIVPVDRPIAFAQAFDKVLMLRAGLYTPLVWDGIDPAGFKVVTKSNPADTSTSLIPNVWQAEYFQDRMFYPLNPLSDILIVSDINDYTSYDPVFGFIRINAGAADRIVRAFGYIKNFVIVFQSRSIHSISNFGTDLSAVVQAQVSKSIGCAAKLSPLMIGRYVVFLSEPRGFVRIGEEIQDLKEVRPEIISDKIEPIIQRLNWGRANEESASMNLCVSALLGRYAYFGLCLDDFTAARHIVVLDTESEPWKWHSVDTRSDPNFQCDALHVTTYNGVKRLFAVNNAYHKVYLLDEGDMDGNFRILDVIETRGYGRQSGSGPGSFKSFRRTVVGLRTLNPSVNLTAISDGFNEEKILPPTITKNRTKFYIHGHKDFDINTDDDTEPKREDYSVSEEELLNHAGIDFEALTVGPISELPASPLITVTGVKQESMERRRIRQIGRYCSIRVANAQGKCDVLGVQVEAIEKSRNVRVAA